MVNTRYLEKIIEKNSRTAHQREVRPSINSIKYQAAISSFSSTLKPFLISATIGTIANIATIAA